MSPSRIKSIGTGLAFVIFPLLFAFAFATHPGLLSPRFLGPEELILRAHQNALLQFGHVLVTLSTVLLIVVALHFMKLLENGPGAWAGLLGGTMAVTGAMILAADKGALCLTMSALDTLPEDEFALMMPGLLAMFGKEGWLALLWGLLLLPLGFAVQAAALAKTRALPRWRSVLFLIGVLFVGTPDGVEIVNLAASLAIGAAVVPYGVTMIVASLRRTGRQSWAEPRALASQP